MMKTPFLRLTILFLGAAVLFSACGERVRPTSQASSRTAVETAAYATALAAGTATPVAIFYIPAAPIDRNDTPTPIPSETPVQTPFMAVSTYNTPTSTATNTPLPPTDTLPVPTATALCNLAEFIQDINTPPGTVLVGGQKFRKIWRVKNVGSCTWNQNYTLMLVSGEAMGAKGDVSIAAVVAPNQMVDLILDLSAPKKSGNYEGGWMLYNGLGQVFGIGANATDYLWVEIEVVNPATATAKPTSKTATTPTTRPTSGSSSGASSTATSSSSTSTSTATSAAPTATATPTVTNTAIPPPPR